MELVNDIEGGFYLWIKLPESINSNLFFIKCRNKSVSILPGTVFFHGEKGEEFFRLSFASADESEIADGITKLEDILSEMLKLKV